MKPYIGLFAVALVACANGQGEVDVSSTNAATFPGAPSEVPGSALAGAVMTTEGSVTLDLRKDLASLSDLGTVSVAISQDSISGADLGFIQHIKATIESEDGKLPVQVASDVDVPAHSTEIELPLLISDSQALEFLTEGKVALHFYVTGNIPERAITLTHTIVAHVSIAVDGSIPKL